MLLKLLSSFLPLPPVPYSLFRLISVLSRPTRGAIFKVSYRFLIAVSSLPFCHASDLIDICAISATLTR